MGVPFQAVVALMGNGGPVVFRSLPNILLDTSGGVGVNVRRINLRTYIGGASRITYSVAVAGAGFGTAVVAGDILTLDGFVHRGETSTVTVTARTNGLVVQDSFRVTGS